MTIIRLYYVYISRCKLYSRVCVCLSGCKFFSRYNNIIYAILYTILIVIFTHKLLLKRKIRVFVKKSSTYAATVIINTRWSVTIIMYTNCFYNIHCLEKSSVWRHRVRPLSQKKKRNKSLLKWLCYHRYRLVGILLKCIVQFV